MECINLFIPEIVVSCCWGFLLIVWCVYAHILKNRFVVMSHYLITNIFVCKALLISDLFMCFISDFTSSMHFLVETFIAFIFVVENTCVIVSFGTLCLGINIVRMEANRVPMNLLLSVIITNYTSYICLWMYPLAGCYLMIFYLFDVTTIIR